MLPRGWLLCVGIYWSLWMLAVQLLFCVAVSLVVFQRVFISHLLNGSGHPPRSGWRMSGVSEVHFAPGFCLSTGWRSIEALPGGDISQDTSSVSHRLALCFNP